MEEKKPTLREKIFAVQHELGSVMKSKSNLHFKSRYFDVNILLEQLKPVLEKHRLLVVQPLVYRDQKAGLLTRVSDIDGSYDDAEFFFPLPEGLDAQKLGGAITFFRRYALTSLFLVEGEVDDDGNTATGREKRDVTPNDFQL